MRRERPVCRSRADTQVGPYCVEMTTQISVVQREGQDPPLQGNVIYARIQPSSTRKGSSSPLRRMVCTSDAA